MDENRNDATAEADICKVVQDSTSAVRRRDITGILRNHSADMLMFDVPPPFQSKGLDAYRETWDEFFSWARDPVVFAIEEMHVTAGSDVAFVTATMKCAGGAARGEEDIELDFRLTIGLRKIDGEWTIMHEHHSIPAGE